MDDALDLGIEFMEATSQLKRLQAISNKVVISIIDITAMSPSKDIHDYKSDSNNFWFFGK